jgi:hypothetical protein
MKITKSERAVQLIVGLYALNTVDVLADAASSINSVYSTNIRPILIIIVVLFFVVTALFHIADFRKGGEAAKEAFIHCVMMAVYPGVVLGLAEAIKALMNAFGTTLT